MHNQFLIVSGLPKLFRSTKTVINSIKSGLVFIVLTYLSLVNVHVLFTNFSRSTPVYWSRLGRNFYGTDRFLPSSYNYSRSENLFRTRSVATDLVTSLEIQPIHCAFMLCQFGQTRNGYVAA